VQALSGQEHVQMTSPRWKPRDALTAASPGRGAAHQSTDAQLHRQPTRSSVARGREEAIADERHDRAALERARAADNRGDHTACVKALSEARIGISPR